MKKLIFAFFFLSTVLTSCDQCKDVKCLNGGTCIDGNCECLTGFFGSSCEDEDVCLSGSLECKNDGECEDGECNCTTFYEGEECEDRVIASYADTYDGIYTCNWQYYTGTAKLKDVLLESEMKIVENSGRTYNIEFDNAHDFEIPVQTISNGSWLQTVSGSGEVLGNDLTFTVSYSYSGSGSSTTCLFSGSR